MMYTCMALLISVITLHHWKAWLWMNLPMASVGGEPRELPGQDIDDSITNGSPGAVEVAGTQSPVHHDCVPCDEHGVEKADGPGTPDDDHARADLDGAVTLHIPWGSVVNKSPAGIPYTVCFV